MPIARAINGSHNGANRLIMFRLGKTSAEKSHLLGPLFSGRQKDVLRVWQEKSTNDGNDNCNDNYDSNDGNFDDYEEKMTKKHTNIIIFQQ